MSKPWKKRIFGSILVIFCLYLLWLGFLILRYPEHHLPREAGERREITGIYHVHTTCSDGAKTPDAIAEIAARQSLDFVILTDHGHPNRESFASQGIKHGVVVLAGSELSVNRGHLVALGFSANAQTFPQNAEEAAQRIHRAQGFTIIAHPYSKVLWSWGEYAGYSGIEIISSDSMLRRNLVTLIPHLPLLLIQPRIALLRLLDRPQRNLDKWNEMTRSHAVHGFYSCDAHFLYDALFSYLRIHLQKSRPLPPDFDEARTEVMTALRQGRFYSAVDAAAPASGFAFWGTRNGRGISMGDSARFEGPVTLNIQTPSAFAREIHVLHDGKVVTRSPEAALRHTADRPGTWRIEVYLRERTPLRKDCPWILSNPIFLRENTS